MRYPHGTVLCETSSVGLCYFGGGSLIFGALAMLSIRREELARRVTVSILGIRNLPDDITVEAYSGGGALGKEEIFCRFAAQEIHALHPKS